MANPPFHARDAGTLAPDALKAGAHAMPEAELERWVRFMARMAAPGGGVTIIHKAEVLGHLLSLLEGRFGALKVLPAPPAHGRAGPSRHRAGDQGQPGAFGAAAGLRAARRRRRLHARGASDPALRAPPCPMTPEA